MGHDEKSLKLPLSIVGRQDIGRLVREIEVLIQFLAQAAIRQSDNTIKIPKTSRQMEELVQINKLNLLVEVDRKSLAQFLTTVYAKAPVLHMSFNTEPSVLFSQKLMTWLRKEIHPLVLLQTGLQPTIGAGCVVRTANKYFDFSVRQDFIKKRSVLIEKLKALE